MKFIKRLVLSLAVLTILLSTITPAISVTASTESSTDYSQQLANTTAAESLSDTQQSKLNKLIKDKAQVSVNKNTTTITISDADAAIAYAKATGKRIDRTLLSKSAGKTKIVFHGALRKGNFDVYLSAKMLNKIKKEGVNGAITIVMALLAIPLSPVGGVAWYALKTGLKKLGTAVIFEQVSRFKAGRKFKIRSWKYSGWSYQ